MIRTFSFYDAVTGIFNGRRLTISDHNTHQSDVKSNAGPGCAYIEGRYDHQSQRVDPATGKVVDYQPPQPSPDHEWNATSKRWQPTGAAQAQADARRDALGRIAALEAGQARAVRDWATSGDPSRLRAIETEISALRELIR